MDGSGHETEIDLENPDDTRARLVEMAGRDKRVLCVGLSTRPVAAALTERGCAVTAVEMDPDEACASGLSPADAVLGGADGEDLTAATGAQTFDVVLLVDVLERLKDPRKLIARVRGLLAPGGCVALSVPNVAHASVRLALLKGQFDFGETGVLDGTQLKYYTKSSICDLLESCGYTVDVVDWVEKKVSAEELHEALDPLGLGNLEEVVKAFSGWEAVARRYVIKAFPADEEAQVRRLSADKVRAERRLKALEREIGEYRRIASEVEKLSGQLAEAEAEIEKSGEYAKSLERMIAQKDDFIAKLEHAVRESRTRLEDCEAQISGMAAAFKELEEIRGPKKKKKWF